MEIFYSEGFKKRLREDKYDEVYLIRGLNHSIFVLNQAQWEDARGKIERMEPLSPLTKDWRDYFSAEPQDLKCKDYRSIEVPRHLQEWSRISEDVVLICWPNRVELWARELFPGAAVFEGVAIRREGT